MMRKRYGPMTGKHSLTYGLEGYSIETYSSRDTHATDTDRQLGKSHWPERQTGRTHSGRPRMFHATSGVFTQFVGNTGANRGEIAVEIIRYRFSLNRALLCSAALLRLSVSRNLRKVGQKPCRAPASSSPHSRLRLAEMI